MHEQQVGSIAIVDAQRFPIGIFTLRDLRQVVADPSAELTAPIERYMTLGRSTSAPRPAPSMPPWR